MEKYKDMLPYGILILLVISVWGAVMYLMYTDYSDKKKLSNSTNELGMCKVMDNDGIYCINGILHKAKTEWKGNSDPYRSLNAVCTCNNTEGITRNYNLNNDEYTATKLENETLKIELEKCKVENETLRKITKEQVQDLLKQIEELKLEENK